MRTLDRLNHLLARLPLDLDRLALHPDDMVEIRKECPMLQATPSIGEHRYCGVLLVEDRQAPRLTA